MGKKYSLEEVKAIFMSYGYILLVDEYKNSKHRMDFYCPDCDSEQTLRLNDLTQGHSCPNCGTLRKIENMKELAVSQRTATEDVRLELIKRGLNLIGTYKNARTKIRFQCPMHPKTIQEARLNDLRSYKCCGLCSREDSKLPYDEVIKRFRDKGYMLLSPYYKNSTTKLYYRCKTHMEHLQQIDIDGITQGHGCYYCGVERYSGENHHRYNPKLTQYEREFVRKFDLEIPKWRIAVFRRDHFTCQVCGQKHDDLNAHHLDGYHWAIDSRYDIENGITLCVTCHKGFHSKYGFGNNTKEQFYEWIASK